MDCSFNSVKTMARTWEIGNSVYMGIEKHKKREKGFSKMRKSQNTPKAKILPGEEGKLKRRWMGTDWK
jgi:hypothetical protein